MRPADSSAKAVFISSIASGIGTSSRTWLRVSTSIRRAPLVETFVHSIGSIRESSPAASGPQRAWSDVLQTGFEEPGALVPLCYTCQSAGRPEHPRTRRTAE